ncbi:hypothetical protein BLNAU_5091 [Blattamonas nauphoetae]|nr:hypothetical protein BLNAU_5091 [Blattamonas nauphoetae]
MSTKSPPPLNPLRQLKKHVRDTLSFAVPINSARITPPSPSEEHDTNDVSVESDPITSDDPSPIHEHIADPTSDSAFPVHITSFRFTPFHNTSPPVCRNSDSPRISIPDSDEISVQSSDTDPLDTEINGEVRCEAEGSTAIETVESNSSTPNPSTTNGVVDCDERVTFSEASAKLPAPTEIAPDPDIVSVFIPSDSISMSFDSVERRDVSDASDFTITLPFFDQSDPPFSYPSNKLKHGRNACPHRE